MVLSITVLNLGSSALWVRSKLAGWAQRGGRAGKYETEPKGGRHAIGRYKLRVVKAHLQAGWVGRSAQRDGGVQFKAPS